MKKINFTELSGKYVGKSFLKYSCMNLLYNWYTDLGIDVPDSFEKLNIQTYLKEWEKDKKQTVETMLRLFRSIGKHAEIDDLQRHDLLAVKEKNNIYPAIYLDNNVIITSHLTYGVITATLGIFHKVILNRRLI